MKFLINLIDLIYFVKNTITIKITHNKRFKNDLLFLDSFKITPPHSHVYNNEFLEYLENTNLKKSILIVELNNFHIELLDSLIYYFTKLGYKCDCLLREEVNFKAKNSYNLSLRNMIDSLNNQRISKYDFVFFNTMFLSLNTQIHISKLLDIKSKFGILGIYHTISDYLKYEDSSKNDNRFFILRPIECKNIKLKPLSCSIKRKTNKVLKKSNIVTFLSIGFPVYHLNFRLNLFKIIKYLLKNNITNFRFILIGRSDLEINKFSDFIFTFKNPSDSKLEKILKIYDPNYIFMIFDTFAHRHYLNSVTSGLRMFSLQHNIPFVINSPFGESFGFSNKNAIIFNNPKNAILKAIKIKNTSDYKSLKENLSYFNDKLNLDSMHYLSNAIKNLTK